MIWCYHFRGFTFWFCRQLLKLTEQTSLKMMGNIPQIMTNALNIIIQYRFIVFDWETVGLQRNHLFQSPSYNTKFWVADMLLSLSRFSREGSVTYDDKYRTFKSNQLPNILLSVNYTFFILINNYIYQISCSKLVIAFFVFQIDPVQENDSCLEPVTSEKKHIKDPNYRIIFLLTKTPPNCKAIIMV